MTRLPMVMLFVSSQIAFASAFNEEMLRCAVIQSDETRLGCFDRVVGDLRGIHRASAGEPDDLQAGSAVGDSMEDATDRQGPSDETQVFGRETMPNRASAIITGPTSIETGILRVRYRPRGEQIFELVNGQTWTELDVGRARYQPGMTVRIERTTFGGYMLSTGNGRAARVRRLD